MRRLDQDDAKRAFGQITVQTTPPNGTRRSPRPSPATLRVRPWFCNTYLCRPRGRFAASGEWRMGKIALFATSSLFHSPFAIRNFLLHPDRFTLHKRGRRSADRRNCPVPRRANRCRHLFTLGAWARYGRARLPALRRGTCGGERTPPLSFSPHLLGPGVIRCYLHLTCPFSPAGCPAVPVVVPDGRIRRSRPREPHSPRIQVCLENTSLKWASYCLVTDVETSVNRKVTPIPPVIGVIDPKPDDVRSLVCGVSSSLQNYRGRGVTAHDQSIPCRWH